MKCSICNCEGEVEIIRESTQYGFLEDFEGYSTAKFKCPNCGYHVELPLHDETCSDEDLIRELQEEIKISAGVDSASLGATVYKLLKKYYPGENITVENVQNYLQLRM
jgi:hypothetical protein